MANEISLSAQLSSNKAGMNVAGSGSVSADQAGDTVLASVQTIGTTTEAVNIGDITDLGYLFVKNMDATNTIRIGLTSPVAAGDAMITLLPGQFAMFPTRIEVIYAIALVAPCNMQVVAISN